MTYSQLLLPPSQELTNDELTQLENAVGNASSLMVGHNMHYAMRPLLPAKSPLRTLVATARLGGHASIVAKVENEHQVAVLTRASNLLARRSMLDTVRDIKRCPPWSVYVIRHDSSNKLYDFSGVENKDIQVVHETEDLSLALRYFQSAIALLHL